MTEDLAGIVYLDASALVKLVLMEAESPALAAFLGTRPQRVASVIVRAEVPRAAWRATHDAAVVERAERLVMGLGLVPADLDVLTRAADVDPGGVRSLDAIHLATALVLGDALQAMVVYDQRLAAAAERHGVSVVAPA